jgi:hypothetical protein
MAISKRKGNRGFPVVMDTDRAAAIIDDADDKDIDFKMVYGPNIKRAGSKARARYAQYSKATSFAKYVALTSDEEGIWRGRADLIYDVSHGLVKIDIA